MGLFSRDTIISVSSTTVNLAGDNQEDYLQKTITTSVLGGSDLSSTIHSSYLNGMGIQIKNAYRYGRDYYSLGLPDGYIFYGVPNYDDLMEVLSSLHEGKQVYIEMIDFSAANLDYWIEEYLTETYGWDEDYGGMANPPPGVPADTNIYWSIDNDAVVTIYMGTSQDLYFTEDVTFTGVDYTAQYYQVIYRVRTPGVPSVSTVTRPYQSGDVAGTVTSEETSNNFGEFTITTTTVETTINAELTQTTIKTTVVVDTLSRKMYFMYAAGTGTYPELDSILDDAIKDSNYYPVVPVRVDNTDLTDPANVSEEQFKTSKILLNKVGLKFTMLGDIVNENPDVDEIDHAFFVMGISLNSQYESSIDYLHEFFKYLAQVSPSTKEDYFEWYEENVDPETGTVSNTAPQPPVNKLSLIQEPYDVTIAYQYSDLVIKSGSIGPVGTVIRERGTQASIIIKNPFSPSTELTADVTTIIFKKQITDLQYEEVETCGLEHVNNVYKGHSVNISGESSLSDPENEGFLIPLCVHVTDAQQLIKRTQMTFDCMHMVFNCYEKTKAKWYQSGIFSVITIAISVVVAVYSGGALAAGVAAAAAAATAAGTSVAIAVTVYIATQVVIGIAVTYGVSLLAKYVGPNVLLIASAAMMAYGAFSAYQSYGTEGNVGLPYASDVMALVPAVSKGAQTQMQNELEEFMSDMMESQENYQKQMKDIEDAMDTMNANPNIDINALMNAAYFNLFEYPDEFFVRTLNTNPGIVTLDTIGGYVDYSLTLPTDLN